MQFVRPALAGLLIAGCLAVSPASASPLTDAFVANAKPNVDFLDKASRLALERSSSRGVKTYAQEVASRETIVANTIVAWWQTNTPAGASAALGTQTQEPAGDALAPFGRVAGNVTSLVDGSLLTGRSVAIDGSAPAARPVAKPLLPSQDADYETLKSLHGRRFDAFYKLTQRNSLRQLVALYRNYASSGDDPALRSLSALQLDKTNDLIERLNTLR